MKQMSKQLAETIATQLTKESKEKIQKLSKEISEFCEKIIIKKTPKEIMELYKTNKEYLQLSVCFYFSGKGLNYTVITLTKSLPYSNSRNIILEDKDAEHLVNLLNKGKIKKDETNKLFNEIVNNLLVLKTSKKIEENFPEAFELIPKTQALVCTNTNEVRLKIKNQ
jgi:polyhydroxyalkanoate synthesis regulator phasin